MTEKYPRGDDTPISRSINEAVKILRGYGIFIDLTKEWPSQGPDYWNNLRQLHDKVWRMVYAQRMPDCKVTYMHDDGDATLQCDGVEHVATTEGKIYREVTVSEPELVLRRICKNGPLSDWRNRRMIPEEEIQKVGEYIVNHSTEDPVSIGHLAAKGNRFENPDYQSAREELVSLFRDALAKSDPALYDKYKRCLDGRG